MTQSTANGGMEILVQASIKHDIPSGLIGAKILKLATPEQIFAARGYCRIKHRYTDKQIDQAMSEEQAARTAEISPRDRLIRVL